MSVAYTAEQQGTINQDTTYFAIEYFEDQDWLSLPVSVKYVFKLKRWPDIKAYANLGASVDFLIKSSLPSDGTTLNTRNDPEVGFTIESTKDHNAFNFGVFAGGGVTVKMGEGFVSLEARYLNSFTKFTKPEKVLMPTDPRQTNTGAQHDIYRLNHLAFSIGYTHHMYYPKKLK